MERKRLSLLRESVIAGLLASLVYAILRQETFYADDAEAFLFHARSGSWRLAFHLAWMPLERVAAAIGSAFGASSFTAASWLSVVAGAVGVAFAHAAFRAWIDDRWRANLATVLLLFLPVIAFFATVVELPAVQFACCGPALLASAAFVRDPCRRTGAWLGLATGCAVFGHATSVLLPVCVLPMVAVAATNRGAARKRVLHGLAWAIAVDVLVFAAISICFYGGAPTTMSREASRHFLSNKRDEWPPVPWLLLHSMWADFAVPAFPASVLCIVALVRRATRSVAVALLPAILAYSLVTALLMGMRTEYGAYFTPVAFFVVLVAAMSVSRPVLVCAVLAAGVTSVMRIVDHDCGEDRTYAAAFAAERGGAEVLLVVGRTHEAASLLLDDEHGTWRSANELAGMEDLELAADTALSFVRDMRSRGKEVWLTDGALSWLNEEGPYGGGELGRHVIRRLAENYEFVPRRRGTFAAVALLPRVEKVEGGEKR